MPHYGWIVHKVIEQSNIIIEVLDARFIEETRNRELEEKIKNKKILIHVINKYDLGNQRHLNKIKKSLTNCVFTSAKKHLGTTLLRNKIKMLAKKYKEPVIGVIGYPNVGKSSIINALKGKGSARTSKEAGQTKGQQYLKAGNFLMIDTPGVMEKGKNKDLVLIGAKNPNTIEDPDLAALTLIKNNPGRIENHYKVKPRVNKEKNLEDIALRLNMKAKGNKPDIERASRKILRDWLNGKIR